jgi:HAMP domain-containing protein
MRIATKVSLLVFVGALVGSSLLAYFVYISVRSELEIVIGHQQAELGSEVMDKIDRLLFTYRIGIQNIGEEETLAQALSGSQRNHDIATRRMKELPFLTGPWDSLRVVDTHGRVVVSSREREEGEDLMQFPATKVAIDTALSGKVYYSDFLISKESNRPSILFSAPIRDQDLPDAPIIGVMVGHLAWPVVVEILSDVSSVSDFDLYTSDGRLVVSTDREELFNIDPEMAKAEEHQVAKFKIVAESDDEQERLTTLSRSEGYLSYKGNDWQLSIETPTEIAFAPARETARGIILIFLPIVSLAVALTIFYLNRYIIKPIIVLTGVADSIAKGDFKNRASVDSKDEVGMLANAVNTMADKIQESQKGLEKEVEEKTAELNKKLSELERLNVFMVDREVRMVELKKELSTLKEKSSSLKKTEV